MCLVSCAVRANLGPSFRDFWVPLQVRAKTLFLTSGQKSARLPVIEWVPGHLQPPTRPGDGSQAPARKRVRALSKKP